MFESDMVREQGECADIFAVEHPPAARNIAASGQTRCIEAVAELIEVLWDRNVLPGKIAVPDHESGGRQGGDAPRSAKPWRYSCPCQDHTRWPGPSNGALTVGTGSNSAAGSSSYISQSGQIPVERNAAPHVACSVCICSIEVSTVPDEPSQGVRCLGMMRERAVP